MKKILLVLAFITGGFFMNAQTQYEVNAAFPTGFFGSYYNFGADFKINYLFSVGDDAHVGPSVGVLMYFGKDIEEGFDIDNSTFLPVGVSGQYVFEERFVGGLNLGYAIHFTPDEPRNGGFYYRPTVGYKITERMTAQVSYSGISRDGATLSHFGLGLVFGN